MGKRGEQAATRLAVESMRRWMADRPFLDRVEIAVHDDCFFLGRIEVLCQ